MDETSREKRQMVEVIRAKGGEITLRDWYRSRSIKMEAGEAELQQIVDAGDAEWFNKPPESGIGRSSRAIRLRTGTENNDQDRE